MTEQAAYFMQGEPRARPRLPYAPPRLVELGELRDITLGASPGVGDSGGTQPQRCPGCP